MKQKVEKIDTFNLIKSIILFLNKLTKNICNVKNGFLGHNISFYQRFNIQRVTPFTVMQNKGKRKSNEKYRVKQAYSCLKTYETKLRLCKSCWESKVVILFWLLMITGHNS